MEFTVPRTLEDKLTGDKLIVILEKASLELTQGSNRTYALLSGTDHRTRILKEGRDPKNVRPDIVHQCLITLLDSPLNRAGRLLVYIRTSHNEIIEVSPQLTVPKTWEQFNALMVTDRKSVV